jgi:rhamnosyltransferase subunit B
VTTLGSLGDLHPFLAVARGMQARGHDMVVATSERYREKINELGLGFAPLRPSCDWSDDPAVVGEIRSWGLERIIRELLLPALRQTYDDTLAATEGADMILAMQGNYAAGLVAEKKGILWASAVHFPLGLFSAYDPPVLPSFPQLSRKLHPLGPAFWKPVKYFARHAARLWAGPWHQLRAEIGLPRDPAVSPLVDAQAPLLHLALFSKLLADKQADWPPQTVVTGFPWYEEEDKVLPAELAQFLQDGPAPIVFTLGSAIASDPREREFFEQSAAAAELLGYRAVLILYDSRNRPRILPKGVVAFDYVPFERLLPHAAAFVHHGGLGGTAMGMRFGRPMLVAPCAWDQPDVAARVARLGGARTMQRRHYTAARVVSELRRLLDDPIYSRRASAVGAEVRQEDGVKTACDALSRLARTAVRERLNS